MSRCPVLAIAKDENKAFELTTKGNFVAVITNGTAILGLGTPLRLVADWPLLLLAAAAYVAVAAVLVGALTLLRGRAPSRAAEVAA